jgi:hypothetical protein
VGLYYTSRGMGKIAQSSNLMLAADQQAYGPVAIFMGSDAYSRTSATIHFILSMRLRK